MSRNSSVIEEAIPAVQIGCGVMTWWTTQTVRKFVPTEHQLRCCERSVYCTTRRVIRTLCNWCRGFETPPTKASICCSWFLQLRHGFPHGRAIEKVWNHFSAWSHFALIINPRGIQEVVQARVMNSVNRVNAPLRWCKKLHGLIGLQHLANVFGASGVFVR